MSTYEQKQFTYAEAFVLPATLANANATANPFFDCANWDEMTIYAEYNPAISGEILTLRVDFAPQVSEEDSALVFHPEVDETVAAGVATLLPKTRVFTSTTGANQSVPVMSVPLNDRFARIFAADNAGTTGVVRLRVILSKISS